MGTTRTAHGGDGPAPGPLTQASEDERVPLLPRPAERLKASVPGLRIVAHGLGSTPEHEPSFAPPQRQLERAGVDGDTAPGPGCPWVAVALLIGQRGSAHPIHRHEWPVVPFGPAVCVLPSDEHPSPTLLRVPEDRANQYQEDTE